MPCRNRFLVHSVAVALAGPGMGAVAQDFSYFSGGAGEGREPPRYRISLRRVARSPKAADLPPVAAERVFPDCVLYRAGGTLYFEYSGAVLAVRRDAGATFAELISADEALSREISYLTLQSELGRQLDRQGLHRVHALGVGLPSGRSCLMLLPSGGGKTTLAAELVRIGLGVLLSDDSPLIDLRGNVHPYPLRMAFKPEAAIPERWRAGASEFRRRRFGTKLLVPTQALPARSLPRPGDVFRPGYLLLGSRHGRGAVPVLRELPARAGALPLFRDMVVGLGLPQIAELVLTRGPRSLPGLAPVAASRAAAALLHASRARTLSFQLARDPERNARYLARQLARLEEGA